MVDVLLLASEMFQYSLFTNQLFAITVFYDVVKLIELKRIDNTYHDNFALKASE